jgi:hypothetical protein
MEVKKAYESMGQWQLGFENLCKASIKDQKSNKIHEES